MNFLIAASESISSDDDSETGTQIFSSRRHPTITRFAGPQKPRVVELRSDETLLSETEERKLREYEQLRTALRKAREALPGHLKKRSANDDEVVQPPKKPHREVCTATSLLLSLSGPSKPLRQTTAERLFARARHDAVLSDAAINLLQSMSHEFATADIVGAELLPLFLRRLLDSGLFVHVVQLYTPTDVRFREAASDQTLVIVRDMSLWYDICAFALYRRDTNSGMPFEETRLRAKWRIEKCFRGLKGMQKHVHIEGERWSIKCVVNASVRSLVEEK